MYDGDDDLRQARRPLVLEAYARQFKSDFKLFLNLRAQELVAGGQMVISLPSTCSVEAWDPMAFILNDMATRVRNCALILLSICAQSEISFDPLYFFSRSLLSGNYRQRKVGLVLHTDACAFR